MKLPVDEAAWTANPAVLAHWTVPEGRCFALQGRSEIILAEVVGGELILFPERSAQHQALKAAIGDA